MSRLIIQAMNCDWKFPVRQCGKFGNSFEVTCNFGRKIWKFDYRLAVPTPPAAPPAAVCAPTRLRCLPLALACRRAAGVPPARGWWRRPSARLGPVCSIYSVSCQ
eukprot:6095973-Prymnesium_polylepis.1